MNRMIKTIGVVMISSIFTLGVNAQSGCNLTASVTVEQCDNGGTPCDPDDDTWLLRAMVQNDKGSKWVVHTASGTYGPFPYAPLPTYVGRVPADRTGSGCWTFEEYDDPTCTFTACVTDTLYPCTVLPEINLIRLVCNDNRTANDPTDDFYKVDFYVSLIASGYMGTFDLDVDGVKFGPFNYNVFLTINLPANGTRPLFQVEGNLDPFCIDAKLSGVVLAPCSTPCEQTPSLLQEVCMDLGTPSPNDDVWLIEFLSNAVTPGKTNKFQVFSPNIPPVPYDYGVVHRVFLPARGQRQTLKFSDIDYDDCYEEIDVGPLDPCSEMCEIKLDSISVVCDDNGTPDPSDDFYRIYLRVTGKAAGSGYDIQRPGGKFGPFDYDSLEVVILPADGSSRRLVIRDVDFATQCNTFVDIGPLEPCSFPCDMEVQRLDAICDNKNTSDKGDDTYDVVVNVNGPLVGPMDMYNVYINGTWFGPFTYGMDHNIPWPADGMTYEVLIEDVVLGDQCQLRDTIGPLTPCSSDCILDLVVSEVSCDDAGTGVDASDDTFTFRINVDGTNVGVSWIADDPNATGGNYGTSAIFGPYLIGMGSVTLTFTDTQDPFCRESVTVSPPAPCSDSCFLDILSVEEGPCNDNNTGPDKTDDFFYIQLEVGGINTSVGGMYSVRHQGTLLGTYNYNRIENVGPIPANGMLVILSIEDQDKSYCTEELRLRKDPCSDCDQNTANAGPDQVITCGENEVTLSGSASAMGVYRWEGPGGRTFNGQNPVVGEPGTYILTVTFDKQCTAMDTVVVSRDQNLPIADPGPDRVLTCKVDTVTLGGGNTSVGMNIIYEWRDAQGTLVGNGRYLQTDLPGRYCFVAIDTSIDCRSASNCVDVDVNRRPPRGKILLSPEDAFDCRVDSISLIAENGDSTIASWEKSSIVFYEDTLWVVDTGIVYLILEDTVNGCTTRLDVDIKSLVDFPIIQIKEPQEITCLNNVITIDGSNSQSAPSILYQWYSGNGLPINGARGRTLQVNTPGGYIFESMDTITGCVNRDTIFVDEDRVYHHADAGRDAIIKCDSPSVNLNAGASTQLNNISYTWRKLSGVGNIIRGNGTLYPEIDGAGVFQLRVRDDSTGCESYDTVEVSKIEPPSIDFVQVVNERCGGEEDGVIDVQGIRGIRPFSYELNGREVTDTRFEGLKPGLFFFRLTDSLGCYADTLLEVEEGNYFDFRISGDTFIIVGDSTILSVDINIPDSEIDQIYWEEDGSVFCFRCLSVTVKPLQTTLYTFRLIDVNGCEYEFDFLVKVQDKNDIYVPNIFTPNGDTNNEELQVFGKNLVRIDQMWIFNRWGELVFYGEDLAPGSVWDGRWNGEYHVPAVLTYMIDAQFVDRSRKRFTGSVTLLR